MCDEDSVSSMAHNLFNYNLIYVLAECKLAVIFKVGPTEHFSLLFDFLLTYEPFFT